MASLPTMILNGSSDDYWIHHQYYNLWYVRTQFKMIMKVYFAFTSINELRWEHTQITIYNYISKYNYESIWGKRLNTHQEVGLPS